MEKYFTGMIPSPPDERDYTLAKAVAYAAAPIEDIMVSYIPQPLDQGPFGMCVAVALAGILEAIEYKQRGVPVLISPKYIYGNRPGGWQGEGMMPREALRMASRFGAVRRELLPGLSDYPTAKKAITPALDGEGLPNRIKGYVRLQGMQDVSDYFRLYDLPILFGMTLTASFYQTPSTGIVPPPSGASVGNHAMRGVGIRGGRLVIQNSWSGWGNNWQGTVDIGEHKGIEMWGAIPEDASTIINAPHQMLLRLGSKTLISDSTLIEMDVAPFAQNNRTWVPLRFVSEALGADVEWYPMPEGKDMVILRWGGEQEKMQ
jgi:hypothetical protein